MVEQSFWEMLHTKRDSLTKSGGIVADYLVQHAEDVLLFVSYSGSTRDMMDTLRLAKENGAKVILITHYDDAPGAALADVVLLCGAQENPLDSGSIPAKLAMLFVANVLVLRYTLDNQELANLSLSRTSQALGCKLL